MKTNYKFSFLVLASILLLGLLTVSCKKDNQEKEIEFVPISCTVNLHGSARDGLSVITMGSGFSLTSDSSQLSVQKSDMPQLFIVTDENDNIRMLYRGIVSKGQSIEINAHSTAVAMVISNPIVANLGDSNYSIMIASVEACPSFPSFEAEVSSLISQGRDLYDTTNTNLMNTLQHVYDEFIGTEPQDSKDNNQLPWADYRPLQFEWANTSSPKSFYLSNYSLVPTYYGTISTKEGATREIVVPTKKGYSFRGIFDDLMRRQGGYFRGEKVLVTLTQNTENTIELTNWDDNRALYDFGLHALGDILQVLPLPLSDDVVEDVIKEAIAIVTNATTGTIQGQGVIKATASSIESGILNYYLDRTEEAVAAGFLLADMERDKWALKMLKIGVKKIMNYYKKIEGGANLCMRIYYWLMYPHNISFCIKYNNDNTVGKCGGDDWVDLGLPSGLLWATRNVGATSPEDYGDYFAWGETTPKSVYDWSTYRYCNGSWNELTKYCNDSYDGYNGFTDNLTILQPGDDAATANYGGRTPTTVEWENLFDNTTSQWITQNGVYGCRFTGSNGNSLFLPAAGTRWDSSLDRIGSCGNYWSSSLDAVCPDGAWSFYFDSDRQGIYNCSRSYGLTVRAVRQN